MRLSLVLVLGALLGATQATVVIRQNDRSRAPDSSTPSPTQSVQSPNAPETTSSPTGNDNGGTTTTKNGGDTTVTSTQTVTNTDGGKTASSATTLTITSTTTLVLTSTAFATTTVTSSNQDTATKIAFVTTTLLVTPSAQQKRDEIAPKTVAPAEIYAIPAGVPAANSGVREWEKRGFVTDVVTVTVGNGGSDTTVINSITKTVLNTATSQTTVTNTITETEQANAKTTITSTSTLTVTSTVVNVGVVQTIVSGPAPTEGPGSDSSGGDGGNNNNNSDSSGLSTGAKAGIGVGAGAIALAVISALLWFLFRRRNKGPKHDPDDFVGASEVPVGGSGLTPMSTDTAAATAFAPGRPPMKFAPEGYRGTARGDGRAGFAKPDPYGFPHNPSPMTTMADDRPNMAEIGPGARAEATPAAELGINNRNAAKWHESNASEIDGNAITHHQSGPIYEMPT